MATVGLRHGGEQRAGGYQAAFDPEPHYGDGDDNALYNLFATWPEAYFTSLPKPQGNRGIDEPYWEPRQSQIFLDDNFRGRGVQRLFKSVIPGPDKLERQRMREKAEHRDSEDGTGRKACFQSALEFALDQAKVDSMLALELAKHCSRLDSPQVATEILGAPTVPLSSSSDCQHQEDDEWNGFSDTESSSHDASTPIPNPSIPGHVAFSIDELQSHVNKFAKEHGFGVVRHNGSGSRKRKTRYVFQCDRYGMPRPSKGTGLRQKRSRKCGCKWKVIAEALEQNEYMWTLRNFANPQHSQHNHNRSISLAAHPIHRRLDEAVMTTIEATSRRVGIRARDVRGIVKEKHPDTLCTRKDIYNARARLRRKKLGGLSPTAALIKLFDERSIPYVVKWSTAEPDRLVGLIWTFPYCVQMWKRFPEIMSFDNTYNTNRFKLPLFQVTGQTCLKSVYNAAFGLIDNERREGFQFLAEGVRLLTERHAIQLPDVVITDYDEQMKAALGHQFPDSQQQLCIHHINANVLLNAKRKWKDAKEEGANESDSDSDSNRRSRAALSSRDVEAVHGPPLQSCGTVAVPHSYQGVLELWKLIVFAENKEEYEKAWSRLCHEFNDQQAILIYLYKTYLPISAQWAHCYIKKYRNFGVRVTSGTEASNNNVKSYLLNGTSHLYGLVEAIEDMLRDQEQDFADNCSQDEVLMARTYSGPGSEYLGELRMVVSQPGLDLIAKEHRRALTSVPSKSCPWPEPIGDCQESCTVSWQLGIPCRHTIFKKLETGATLTKWDIHPRWHLRQPSSRNPYRRILDPKIATSLRGRPKNATQPVPEHMAINRKARAASAGTDTQSRCKALGPGEQTGMRQAGRRRQPSLRRRRSEWETVSDDELPEPPRKRQRRSASKRPATPKESSASTSSKDKCQDCINVQL